MTLLTALLVAPAHAVDVKFCAKYKVNYTANSEWAAVPTGSTPNQDRPYIRMRDAAHTLLTNDADWDDHLDNGVAH